MRVCRESMESHGFARMKHGFPRSARFLIRAVRVHPWLIHPRSDVRYTLRETITHAFRARARRDGGCHRVRVRDNAALQCGNPGQSKSYLIVPNRVWKFLPRISRMKRGRTHLIRVIRVIHGLIPAPAPACDRKDALSSRASCQPPLCHPLLWKNRASSWGSLNREWTRMNANGRRDRTASPSIRVHSRPLASIRSSHRFSCLFAVPFGCGSAALRTLARLPKATDEG